MSDKKTILVLILIISTVIILIGVLITIYKVPINEENIPKGEKNDLYFISQVADQGYGICKSDGTVVLEPIYSQIARVDNSVYLRTETESYIYFLNNGEKVSLGGKEAQAYFVYDYSNALLPYFVLRYGASESSSVYRIFNDRGIRHDTKDFASLNDAYKFLNAKELFVPLSAPDVVRDIYSIVSTLKYPTYEGKTQYVVTKKEAGQKLRGLVDEVGRVILECSYDSLSGILESTNAIEAIRNDRTYLFLASEKLIEVEPGFEFLISSGYFLQKKGNTVNKIYNLSGEVVIDGIYSLREDFTALNSKEGISYLLVRENDGIYCLYNVTNNKKSESKYTKVVLDYFTSYGSLAKHTSFIYEDNGEYFAVDLNTLKAYKINLTTSIFSPLDYGMIYKSK